MTLRAPLALVVLLATFGAPLGAQEWTRFRGPNGSGESETSVPAQWSDGNLLFRVELPAQGHSSPVLWGQRVFLTGAQEQGQKRLAFCLDALSGKLLWQKEFAGATYPIHRQNSFASSTPAVDAERVYLAVVSPEQYSVVALSHDGHQQWKADLGPFESQHGFGTSPIVYGELVVINNDQDGASSLVALERKTGRVRWKAPRRTVVAAYSTPCVFRPASGPEQLIFNSQAHGISSVNPQDGSTNWEIELFDKRSVSSPLVAGGLVFGSCGSGAGGNYLVAVRPGSKPEVVYKFDKAAPYVPTAVAKGDLLFLWSDNGIVSCLQLADGKLVWQKRVGGTFSGSPVRAGDKLIGVSYDGEAIVLAAAREYQELGRYKLGDVCRSTPALALGRIYLRSESQLVCVGGK